MVRRLRLLGVAVAVLLPAAAIAQAPPTPQTPVAPQAEQLDPNACAKNRATIGQGGDIDTSKPGDRRSLSDKLAQSEGVICPPARVDPEIRQPAPPGGAMKVIPPPGSPGGDQSIQPK